LTLIERKLGVQLRYHITYLGNQPPPFLVVFTRFPIALLKRSTFLSAFPSLSALRHIRRPENLSTSSLFRPHFCLKKADIMKFALTILAAMGLVAAAPERATSLVARSPKGCKSSYDGPFQAAIVDLDNKKVDSLKKRAACGDGSQLMVTLKDGTMTDAKGRTGYIAANFQFQFDKPPQAGTLVDSGFSVCSNGSIALADSAVFYQCKSGSFSNLYDRHWAAQCSPVHIQAIPCGDVESVQDKPAGKVVGTMMMQTTLVTVLEDGQPQVVPTEIPIPICQIDDGQVQGHTTPCASLPAPTMTIPEAPRVDDDSGR
jgi:hypothetical protein